jgi:hypothetical protein
MSGILAGIVRRNARSAQPKAPVVALSAAEIAARAAAELQWERERMELVAALRRGEAEVAGLRERLQTHWWAKLDPSRQGVV